MRKVISFDIDGTLEVGDPPGAITMAMVRQAQALGYIIGSCSDRPVSVQLAIWEAQGITVDFAVPKHRLSDVRSQFEADAYAHIGDTNIDQQYALEAGFEFIHVLSETQQPWMLLNPDGVDGRLTGLHGPQVG